MLQYKTAELPRHVRNHVIYSQEGGACTGGQIRSGCKAAMYMHAMLHAFTVKLDRG